MQKILLSVISLMISVSLLVGAPVTEKESDANSFQKEKSARKNKDHSFVKSEAETWVKIEAKILEVDEDVFHDAAKIRDGSFRSLATMPDSMASILLNALTREKSTELLSMPLLTAKNGEEATIKVVQEFASILPQGKPSAQTTDVRDGGDERPHIVQELGFELSFTPTVQKNNEIDLLLDAKVKKHEGFVEQNKGIPLPILSKRKIATQVTLPDGTTAIIGGISRKEIKIIDDKIPVLRNLPLVGGIFSNENNQTRSLLIFVSANIVSAEGSPVRENSDRKLKESKAEQKQLAEQLNKVKKNLAQIRTRIDQPTGESPKSSKVEIIGIGAKLMDVNGSCTIAELIPGGPAEKSQQLEPKDVILKVSKTDGTLADVSDMKLSEIVELIKGPKNSKVKLLIQPFKNPSTPKEVSIKRKPFHIYHQTHENKVSEKADPVPSDTPSGNKLIIHIVKKGDTVKSIAKKYGSKVKWIVDANQLTDPKRIKVGEKISIPQKNL